MEREVRQEYLDAFDEFLGEEVEVEDGSVVINLADLAEFNSDLASDIVSGPGVAITSLERAVEKRDGTPDDVRARVTNVETDFRRERKVIDIGHRDEGTLVSVDATVKNVESSPHVLARVIRFKCQSCMRMTKLTQSLLNNNIREPPECPTEGCRGLWVEDSVDESVDGQKLVIQDPPSGEKADRTASIEVKLIGRDIVDEVAPGDRVTLHGVVHTEVDHDSTERQQFLVAYGIESSQQDMDDIELDEETVEEIRHLAESEDIHDKIARSIAPEVAGMEEVRRGAAYQLFGGVEYDRPSKKSRGNIHSLFAGPPGVAKTLIASYMEEVIPISNYADASGATKAGLTASVNKDERIGEWQLDAGVLARSSGGLAVVDEVDEASTPAQEALGTALEDQIISVDKADIHTKIPAKASAVLIANPKGGTFDDYEGPKIDQVELPKKIKNRMDLIYAIEDVSDEEHDREVVENLMGNPEESAPIDKELLKSYVVYARTEIQPEWSGEAYEYLKDTYVDLRSESSEEMIDPRRMDTVRRLAEASSRMSLDEEVTIDDVDRAVDVFITAANQSLADADGRVDLEAMSKGRSKSQYERRNDIIQTIDEMVDVGDEYGCSTEVVVGTLSEDYDPDVVEDEIETMISDGDLWWTDSGGLST